MIQLQFLNHLLETGDTSLITLNNLNAEFFSDYSTEFAYIKAHIDTYSTIPDKITFLSKFPDFDVIEVKESDKYLVDALYEDRNRRLLAKVFNDIRKNLNEGNTEKALQIYRESQDIVESGKSIQAVDILRDTSRYDDYVERCKDFEKFYVKTGFNELDDIIGGWDRKEELATIVARTNSGKCLAKGTEILMADGTLKKVEDIKVGDRVQSLNRINTVLALHSGKSKGYKIIPNMGDPFTVSENHILTLMRRKAHWDASRKISSTRHEYDLVDITIEDYIKLPESNRHKYSLYRPSVEYERKADLKIPPYILGLWLGDGTACRAELTSADEVIIREWENYAKSLNLICRKNKETLIPSRERLSKAHSYDITCGERRGPHTNVVLNYLKFYNLISNKHIPLDYLTGDREQRLQLLAGILDTDGYYNKYGYELILSNYNLVKQVAQLSRGLGFRVGSIKEHHSKGFISYGIAIYGPHLNEIPIKLDYKVAHNPTPLQMCRELNLTGFKIEEVPEVEYYGFMADGDQRYLLADNTITHNTWILLKMAIAAAEQGLNVGIYSGEMSERKVGYRVDTLISHISNAKITHGNVSIQQDYKKFIDSLSSLVKGSIKVITPSTINGPAGVSALRAFIEKEHLDMLCVDQHSLLEDDRGARNPVERAANISKDLKNLQTLKKIPIIAVSQQNREKLEEGGSFNTTQIAQSDRIGQDSTIVIFFEQKDSVLTIYLTKSRDSVNGKTLKYAIDLDRGIFNFIPTEDDATNGQYCANLKKEFEIDTGESPF